MPITPIKQKDKLDKFYTNPTVATQCINYLLSFNLTIDYWLEPSAGNGSFSNQIPNIYAIDIAPEHPNIFQADFLTLKVASTPNICTIGNPPFGLRNELTKKFIKKAITFSGIVGFVLPEVFNKPINQKVFPEEWKLIGNLQLAENAFLFEGNPYTVPAVFQVWTKQTTKFSNLRKEYIIPKGCVDFSFTTKADADLFIFGAAPKNVLLPNDVKPNNRGYYLKSNIPIPSLINNIQSISWNGNSSANGGVFWLSKQELIEQYLEKKQ